MSVSEPDRKSTVLLTGFEPFGGSMVNPSQMVIETLRSTGMEGVRLETVLLPVDYKKAPGILHRALDSIQPDIAICLGEASGRSRISIERVAVNLLDFRIPDNQGQTIEDEPVIPGAPAAYFTSLPHKHLLNGLLEEGIPAELSMSAGTYLCNQVCFFLMYHRALRGWEIPAGFIHLPSLPEQAAAMAAQGKTNVPSMSLEVMVMGVRKVVEVLSQ